MQGLRTAKLTAKKIPENETLKDDDKAWEYFDELKFDVILANPPFTPITKRAYRSAWANCWIQKSNLPPQRISGCLNNQKVWIAG